MKLMTRMQHILMSRPGMADTALGPITAPARR